MIELTDFQYEVLVFMAKFDLTIYENWPTDRYFELYALEEAGLLVQTNETQGMFMLTPQGRAMFKDAGIRRIQ